MTNNLGLGLSPMGFAPFGFGVPAFVAPPMGNILEANPNGASQDARFIDPYARDYVIDSNGLVQGQPSIQQQVFLAVMTTLGTSAIPALGNQLFNLKTFDASTVQGKVQNYIQVALSTLVRSGAISLSSVVASINPNNVCINIAIQWIDNTTGKINTTNVLLNG